MQKAFKDIMQRLEDKRAELESIAAECRRVPKEFEDKNIGYYTAMRHAKEIVNQVAEEYKSNDKWIPVEEKYPDTDEYILLSFSNFTIPVIGRYEKDENGGAFYCGDEDETLVSQDLFVNAWMPLVKPYKLEEPLKDCNTCANYTEPDEVDNGCYMCCKGYENNYQPKGE